MTNDPLNVYTSKAVANKAFIRKSKYLCKSIIGIDAIQLYPYSICQDTPTDFYKRSDYNVETKTLRQGKIEFLCLKI